MAVVFEFEKGERECELYVRTFTMIKTSGKNQHEQLNEHLEVRVCTTHKGIQLIIKKDLLVDPDKRILVETSSNEYKEIKKYYLEYMKTIV